MRRLVSRVLDGPHPWGELRVGTTARGTWRTYRLVVLPPGVDATGRRLMRLRLSWPLIGALLAFAALAVGADHVAPALLTAVTTAGYLASVVVVFRLSRRIDRATLRLSAAEYRQGGAPERLGDPDRIRAAAAALARLDAAGLDPLAYEAAWWRIYEELAAEPSGSRRPA